MCNFTKYFPKKGVKIAVALSGGSDSMALALLLNEYLEDKSVLTCLIIDHKLRPDSTSEALHVASMIKEIGIKAEILTWHHEEIKSDIQNKARIARYDLLTNYCLEHNINYLLTGHNLDDVAENLVMRLIRGSGVDGLSGIPEHTKYNNIEIIRPLLEMTKQDLQNYLLQNRYQWVEDPTNKKDIYERNKTRKFLKSASELYDIEYDVLIKRLSKVSQNLQSSKKIIDGLVDKFLNEHIIVHPKLCYIEASPLEFYKLEIEIALKILLRLITKLNPSVKNLQINQLESLYVNVISKKNEFKATIGGVVILTWKGKLLLFKEIGRKNIGMQVKEMNFIWNGLAVTIEKKLLNKYSNKLQIKYLTEDNYKKLGLEIKNRIKDILMPKDVIYNLPSVFDEKENILTIPAISYYSSDEFVGKIDIKLLPLE